MKKILSLLALLISLPAFAQDIPNHSVPVGGGAGFSGFRSAGPCTAAQLLTWSGGVGVDPSCSTTLPSGVVVGVPNGGTGQTTLTNHGVIVGQGTANVATVGPCTQGFFIGGTGAGSDPTCQAFLNTGTGAANRTWNSKSADIFSIKDYGAVGDGVANDSTPMANCVAAAQAVGGGCYVPAGRYVVTSPVSITGHVRIFGDGIRSTGNHAYIPCCGVANLTSAETANASTILPGSTNNVFNIATNDAVQIDHLQIVYTTSPTALSGITAITVTGGASGTCNFTSISDNMIAGADRGISVTDCVQWGIKDNYFYNQVSYGILINSSSAIPSSDWIIRGNTFLSGSATTCYHIVLSGQGGGRIESNKLNSCGSVNTTRGILVNPTTNTGLSIEPLVIVGNTIEGTQVGIEFFGPSISSGSSSTQIAIVGNQIWNSLSGASGACIATSAGPASIQWISGLLIASNFCNHQGGGGPNLNIDGANVVFITSNLFTNLSGGSTAVLVGANTASVKISNNLCGTNTICSDVREILTANRTYFVRNDGNNNCNGLTNAAGSSGNCAFLTPQACYDKITNALDLAGKTVTCTFGTANTNALSIAQPWTGGGAITFDGGAFGWATTGTNTIGITAVLPGTFTLQNSTLSTTGGSIIAHGGVGLVKLAGTTLIFNATGTFHLAATNPGATIDGTSITYHIGAGANAHFIASGAGAKIVVSSGSVVFDQNVTFATAFAQTTRLGFIQADSWTFNLNAKTVTGTRSTTDANAVNFTNAGAAACTNTFYPGTVNGTTATGGQCI